MFFYEPHSATIASSYSVRLPECRIIRQVVIHSLDPIWSGTLDTPVNGIFVASYRSRYGIEPDNVAAQSYATLIILHAAIVDALSTDTAAPEAGVIACAERPPFSARHILRQR